MDDAITMKHLAWERARRDNPNISTIHVAVHRGDHTKLEQLLRGCEPVYEKTSYYTPLHLAAEIGNAKAAALLLDFGYPPDASYVIRRPTSRINLVNNEIIDVSLPKSITPLFLAIMNDHKDVAEVLLRSGALAQGPESRVETYLLLKNALFWGREWIFNLLTEHVKDLKIEDKYNLMHVALQCQCHRSMKQLLDVGFDPNTQGPKGTVWHWSIIHNDLDALNMLLAAGGEVNLIDKDGYSALHLAARVSFRIKLRQNDVYVKRFPEAESAALMVKTLLLHGAKPMLLNAQGWTALEFAAGTTGRFNDKIYQFKICEDAVEWLLIFGAKWNGLKADLIRDRRSRIAEVIVEFNVKKQIAGFEFELEAKIDGTEFPTEEWKKRCLAELKSMKAQVLFKNLTMFNFLRSTKRNLVVLASQKQVKETFEKATYKSDYPIYKNFLEYNFCVGQTYEDVYEPGYNSLYAAVNCALPSFVIDRILDYTDKDDLNNLIKALEVDTN